MIINEYQRFLKFKNKTKISLIIFRTLYYFLNLSAIFTTLFIGLITIIFLAGTSTFYPEGITNPYRSFLNENSNFIVLIYIINALTALVSGILSFFVINTRYARAKIAYQRLTLEHLLFTSDGLHYENLTEEEKKYRLYRRSIVILGLEKYDTDDISENKIK